MTEEGVEEFSQRWGLAPAAARRLAEQGLVDARKNSDVWWFASRTQPPLVFSGRPLGPRMLVMMEHLLTAHRLPEEVPRQYRARLRAQIARLEACPDPGMVLRTWFRHHVPPKSFDASPALIAELRKDHRLMKTGISYFTDGRQDGGPVKLDARCIPADYSSVVSQYALRSSTNGTLWLRRLPKGSARGQVQLGQALIDLSWHADGDARTVLERELVFVIRRIAERDPLYFRHPGPL